MKRFLIITIFLVTFNSEARLKIEIAKGTEQLQKIAIVPFNSNVNNQFEYQVRNLINEKLTLFGEFESLDLSQMLSFPFNEENFFVRDWELLSIDYVIFGKITETDEYLEINYVVSDINLKRIMLSGNISGSKKDINRFVTYPNFSGIKKSKELIKIKKIEKKLIIKNKLTPEMNTTAPQLNNNKIDCPRSG